MITAKRNYRASWRRGAAESEDDGKDFALMAVGLWSVVGVAMATLLAWLALGGELASSLE